MMDYKSFDFQHFIRYSAFPTGFIGNKPAGGEPEARGPRHMPVKGENT